MFLVSEIDSEFTIECATGFLEAEIVVELGVSEVAALKRYVVSAVAYAVGQGEIMGELIGYHVFVAV